MVQHVLPKKIVKLPRRVSLIVAYIHFKLQLPYKRVEDHEDLGDFIQQAKRVNISISHLI